MTTKKLEGRKILVLEDEYFQARDVKAFLEREGATVVGPTGYADKVPALLKAMPVDVAILDINLGTGVSYSVANLLMEQGVPFLFLTGYDRSAVPPAVASVPRIEKPATEPMVIKAVTELL